MCHFITAAIRETSSIDRLNTIAREYYLKFTPIRNPYVEDQLPDGLSYLSKSTNHCDCGTVLGCLKSSVDSEFHMSPKEIQKLQKKGWSKGKINRWIADCKVSFIKLLSKSLASGRIAEGNFF